MIPDPPASKVRVRPTLHLCSIRTPIHPTVVSTQSTRQRARDNRQQTTDPTVCCYTMFIIFVATSFFVLLCLNTSIVQPASIRPISINNVDIFPHNSFRVGSTRKSTQPPLREMKCPPERNRCCSY